MLGITLVAMAALAMSSTQQAQTLPVVGLHFGAPSPDDLKLCTDFIRDALPKEGVNTLVIEFDYGYQFKSHPEMARPGSLSTDQVKQIVQACKDAHVRLIPQINLLGHQSWAAVNGELLTKHPEFDETPNKFPGNKDIYCRSYCPLHPEVHKFVFDLVDELADACEADAVHVGMDEVMILADPDCPRCRGKAPADLLAREVNCLYDHLKETHRQMWMWGDRFIDGGTTGIGDWEASGNQTASAIDNVPKDIMICDWHYDRAEPTAAYFALKGLDVVSSPWRRSDVALAQLDLMRSVRKNGNKRLAPHMQGMLHTTWCGNKPFIDAYYGRAAGKEATETAKTFKDLCAAIRSSK